jgi:hypothetical protein
VIIEAAANGDLDSGRSGAVKGRHVIDSALSDSFVLESAGSSFVNVKSCLILRSSFVEEVTDS